MKIELIPAWTELDLEVSQIVVELTLAGVVQEGGGDMLKSVYDINNSGIVDKVEGLEVVAELPEGVEEGRICIKNHEVYINII